MSHVPDGLQPKKQPANPLGGQSTVEQGSFSSPTSFYSFPRSGSILIQVKDSGVGLSDQELQEVFQEGVQFSPNRHQAGGGSGLGLCISKGIIERHDGVIVAKSPGHGHGCTFEVELPLYDSTDMQNQSEDVESPVLEEPLVAGMPLEDRSAHDMVNGNHVQIATIGQTTNGTNLERLTAGTDPTADTNISMDSSQASLPPQESTKHHVLVVDDVLSNRKMLLRLLERAGHSCVAAEDGQEAIEIIMANKEALSSSIGDSTTFIDCVLMDFEMPIKNGPDATKELRELGYEGMILGVTGNVLKEDVDFFLQHGADDVLPKPVSMALLNDCWKKRASQKPQRAPPPPP